MSTSSIDDLLLGGGNATQPKSPESDYSESPEEIEEIEGEDEQPEYDGDDDDDVRSLEEPNEDGDKVDLEAGESHETDEYGNEKEKENPVIRERLKKQAESMSRRHEAELNALRQQLAQQNAAPAIQQATKDFEYDPNAQGDWQQQLASFVKQTIKHMNVEEQQQVQSRKEAEIHQEFESNFGRGMQKFDDFAEVVGGQPIDDAMTLALRGMSDPAAFIYAAAKRNPQELERISKLRDPYARMVEMGKLEERMRKNKPTTKAPRPLGRARDDSTTPNQTKKKSEPSIEDLIAKADAKKLQRRRNLGTRR